MCIFLIKNTCTKTKVSYLVLTHHIKKSNTLPLVHYLSFILLYLRDCLTFFSNHPCQRLLTRTFSFEEEKKILYYFSAVGKLCKRKNCIRILKPYDVFFTKLPVLRFFWPQCRKAIKMSHTIFIHGCARSKNRPIMSLLAKKTKVPLGMCLFTMTLMFGGHSSYLSALHTNVSIQLFVLYYRSVWFYVRQMNEFTFKMKNVNCLNEFLFISWPL